MTKDDLIALLSDEEVRLSLLATVGKGRTRKPYRSAFVMSEARRAAEVLLQNGFQPGTIRVLLNLPMKGDSLPSMSGRTSAMMQMYASGKTLEQIGDEFGITRERVRQLLKGAPGGKSVQVQARKVALREQKKAARDARCQELFGCDYETATLLNDGQGVIPYNKSKAAVYLQQKRTMTGPYINVPFSLTFSEWLKAWGDKYCFKGRGKWALVRIDDSKGFEAGNVEPRPIGEKAAETMRRTRARMERIRSMLDAGLTKDQIAKELNLSQAYLAHLGMSERRFQQ